MGLPGSLAQDNDEIGQFFVRSVLGASWFHKKHHINSKGVKKDISITLQQTDIIVRKSSTCSLNNQILFPAESKPKVAQSNKIWQMYIFHFSEYWKLKYVNHPTDIDTGFQSATGWVDKVWFCNCTFIRSHEFWEGSCTNKD